MAAVARCPEVLISLLRLGLSLVTCPLPSSGLISSDALRIVSDAAGSLTTSYTSSSSGRGGGGGGGEVGARGVSDAAWYVRRTTEALRCPRAPPLTVTGTGEGEDDDDYNHKSGTKVDLAGSIAKAREREAEVRSKVRARAERGVDGVRAKKKKKRADRKSAGEAKVEKTEKVEKVEKTVVTGGKVEAGKGGGATMTTQG